ncbi:DUF6161 domain-containing protein [Paenibacillus sediminis]|uniref:DUF6161 domain-containing protein n=1 Tax=Paenibacillus sediminis TaxID=664909 RepID=A0ABS4H379_9BACL|nr:DUF6161 domain-containing protein [Paenibacillus sediminis]MBP1936926.1 hypothetical protein [Paenibacillus sediminis]
MSEVLTQDWLKAEFETKEVVITLFPSEIKKKIHSFEEFEALIQSENDYWSKLSGNSSSYNTLYRIWNHYSGINNNLNQVRSYAASNQNHASSCLLNAITQASINYFPAVHSSTKEGQFLYNLGNPERSETAASYLFDPNSNRIQNILNIQGIIDAYFFRDVKKQLKRDTNQFVDSEAASIEALKSNLTTEVDNIISTYTNKKEELISEIDTRNLELNTLKSEQENTLNKLHDTHKEKLESMYISQENHFSELDKEYRENIKLSAPAQYWADYSNEYSIKGDKWRKWSIATSIIFLIFLTALLLSGSNLYFVSNNTLNINAVKDAILITMITSIFVYFIRLFVKLTTSSYHLATDAKEREQLTYVYLSLVREKGVADSDRAIVLQALFSRSDTGLLKGDSSPAMPQDFGSLINKIKLTN